VTTQRESRRLQRTRFDAIQHFDAIDADLDGFEAQVASLSAEIKGMRAVLTGLLVSISLLAIAAAANIVLHAV
jgi:hypothetical protein